MRRGDSKSEFHFYFFFALLTPLQYGGADRSGPHSRGLPPCEGQGGAYRPAWGEVPCAPGRDSHLGENNGKSFLLLSQSVC